MKFLSFTKLFKSFAVFSALFFFLSSPALAYKPKASEVRTDTTNFDNNLSSADDNLQKALDTLDEAAGGGLGDVQSAGDCASGACGDGSSDGGTYYRLYDGNSHYGQLDTSDLTANRTVNIPNTSGTLLLIEQIDTFSELNAVTSGIETGLEAILDLQDFQGAVTDSQVPNNITIDLATTASALAADPTGCSAGSAGTDIDAAGVMQGCADYIQQSELLDEDNMASNSATQPASQQSIKAYVDTQDAAQDECSEITGCLTEPILGTETSGNYVAAITGGDGIASTGATTGENINHTLSIDLEDVDAGGSTTGSASGLEFVNGELTLLQGCNGGDVLQWNNTEGRWKCDPDNSGGGGGSDLLIQVGDSNITATGTAVSLDFNGTQFSGVETSGEVNISIQDIYLSNTGDTVDGSLIIEGNARIDGTTTGTFVGDLTGNVTGNATTASALAADPTGCSAGSAGTDIDAAGVMQGCADYIQQSELLDEDNMASNSATQPASQQSIKAYVDTQDAAQDECSEITGCLTEPILGTETSGNYVAAITGGDGIASTGATTGENISHTLSVDLMTVASNGVGTTNSVSGLEFISSELSLLQGCSDDQILKWDEITDAWHCESDATGAGSGAFSDSADPVVLNTSTKQVTIGSSSSLAKLAVDGDANEIQALIQAFSGQTANSSVFVVENSAGTDLFTVDAEGDVVAKNTVTGTQFIATGTDYALTAGDGTDQDVLIFRIDISSQDCTLFYDDSEASLSTNCPIQITGQTGPTELVDVNVTGTLDISGTLVVPLTSTVLWADSNGTVTGTTVTSGGAPTDANYLVGSANGTLSNEIVVGTTPGGELGGSWASPTIDDSVSVSNWNLTTTTLSGTTTLASVTGTLDASSGGLRLPTNTTCPTGCGDGDSCYDSNATSGQRWYICESGSWTLQGDGGGGFDSTTVDNTTWSDGANASNTWTFDVSGTDHTMVFSSNLTTLSGSLTIQGVTTHSGAAVFAGTERSTITEGLVVNSGQGGDEDDDFSVLSSTGTLIETDAGDHTLSLYGTVILSTVNGSLNFGSDICAGLDNGGALTTDANGNLICENDDGGAGSGDNATVNSTAIDTTMNLLDNAVIEFNVTDGGAGGPDDVTGTLALEGVDYGAFKDGATVPSANDFVQWNGSFRYRSLSEVMADGNGLTYSGTILNFDGGDSPGGELGGTWSSPTIDDGITVANFTLDGTTTITSTTGTLVFASLSSTVLAVDSQGTVIGTTVVGSGDVTGIGNCPSGECFNGTQGTTLTFNNASGDGTLTYVASTQFNFDSAVDVPLVGINNSNPAWPLDIRINSTDGQAAVNLRTSDEGGLIQFELVGTDVDSPALPGAAENIGFIDFFAWDGNTMERASRIRGGLDINAATIGDGDIPGNLEFWTSPDGTANDLLRMVINEDGNIIVGSVYTDLAHLSVIGNEDEIQFNVRGHSSQTGTLVVFEQNTGLDIMTIKNDGNVGLAGTMTADAIFVDTEVYDATGWNGDLSVPTKDAIRDKIETLGGGIGGSTGGTDNAILKADGTGGSTLQASGIIIDDSDNVTGINQLTVNSSMTVNGTLTLNSQAVFQGTDRSTITEGLVVNSGGGSDEDDDFSVLTTAGTILETDAGDNTIRIGDGVTDYWSFAQATGAMTNAGAATLTFADGSDLLVTANPNASPFLAVTGDVGTGDFDFGGSAQSFEIPNGATVTDPNVAGEMAIDTTTGQLLWHDGTAQRVGHYENINCMALSDASNVTVRDNYKLLIAPRNITVVGVSCGIDGTSATIDFEDDADNAIESAFACDNTSTYTWDTAIAGTATIAAGEAIEVDVTASTATTGLSACVRWVYDAD